MSDYNLLEWAIIAGAAYLVFSPAVALVIAATSARKRFELMNLASALVRLGSQVADQLQTAACDDGQYGQRQRSFRPEDYK